MSLGLIVLALWLIRAAAGPEQYQYFRTAMSGLPGRLLLMGWSFAFFLHLCNGVRHLVWDSGHGFEKPQANAGAWLALLIAFAATAILWSAL